MNKYCEIALLTSSSVFPDLGLLFSQVLMGMLVFGSLAYYIENEEEDTGFYSIPQVVPLTISDGIGTQVLREGGMIWILEHQSK